MPTIRELKKRLENHSDDEACAWSFWGPMDVMQVMDGIRTVEFEERKPRPPHLTADEIADVLASVQNDQDASVGINWELIEQCIQNHLQENGQVRIKARLVKGQQIRRVETEPDARSSHYSWDEPETIETAQLDDFAPGDITPGCDVKLWMTCGRIVDLALHEIEIVEEGDDDEET